MTWTAVGSEALFPRLEDRFGAGLSGPGTDSARDQRPLHAPLGGLGKAIDRALLHRVAEATVKDFLDRAADTLVTLPAIKS